jgi:hypothetical protein
VYPVLSDGSKLLPLSVNIIEGKAPPEELILRYFAPVLVGLEGEEYKSNFSYERSKSFFWDDQAQAIVLDKLERRLAVRSIEFRRGQSYEFSGGSPYDNRPSRLVVKFENDKEINVLEDVTFLLQVERLSKVRREKIISKIPAELFIQTQALHDEFNGWWGVSHESLAGWLREK